MARNFGLTRQIDQRGHGSAWPLVSVMLVALGLISAAAHLGR